MDDLILKFGVPVSVGLLTLAVWEYAVKPGLDETLTKKQEEKKGWFS